MEANNSIWLNRYLEDALGLHSPDINAVDAVKWFTEHNHAHPPMSMPSSD